MKDKAVFAREDEIKQMNVGWQFYHIFKKPPHKHEGVITLEKTALKIQNKKKINIPYKKIVDLHLGFDDVFKRRMSPFRPLRIKYRADKKDVVIYLFVGFRVAAIFSLRAWPIPQTKNQHWLNLLEGKTADLLTGKVRVKTT